MRERVGAVNTVVRKDGRLIGYNTDVAGVAGRAQERGLRARRAERRSSSAPEARPGPRPSPCSRQAARVVLANRTFEKAREAARRPGVRGGPPRWPILRPGEGRPARLRRLLDDRALVDPVPAPARAHGPRRPLRAAPPPWPGTRPTAGCTVIDGREWLLAQAAPAFSLFTGRTAPLAHMRKALWKKRRDSTEEHRPHRLHGNRENRGGRAAGRGGAD